MSTKRDSGKLTNKKSLARSLTFDLVPYKETKKQHSDVPRTRLKQIAVAVQQALANKEII